MTGRNDRNGDVISAEQFSVQELRDVVFGASRRLSRELALQLLGRKSYPEKVQDMARVLADPGESPRTRHVAATELGRVGTEPATAALRAHLAVEDPLVRRGVEKALGGVEGLAVPSAERAPWSAVLAAYSRGTEVPNIPFPRPDDMIRLAPAEAVALAVDKMSARQTAALLRTVSADLPPGLSFARQQALRVGCAGRMFAILLTAHVSDRATLVELLGRKAVPAVVAVRSMETGDWRARLYVLTQPAGEENTLQVLVATTGGQLVSAGTATVTATAARFVLQAVRRPGAVAVDIEGVLEAGEVRLERAAAGRQVVPGIRPG